MIKTALITGASQGIGFETVRKFAHQVQNIIFTGRDEVKLAEAKKALEMEFPLVTFYAVACDHASQDSVYSLLTILSQLGLTINYLVLNVGYNQVHDFGPRKIERTDLNMLITAYNVNVLHAHIMIVDFLKNIKSLGGTIIFLGSQAYKYGVKGQLAYNVTKASLVGYKNSIVSEYGAKGVYCYLINPGIVLNKRTQALRKQIGSEFTVTEEDVAIKVAQLAFDNIYENGVELDI